MRSLGIIGGGAWGSALAHLAATNGLTTTLWAQEPEVVAAVNDAHRNPLFLPDIALNPAIRASGDLAEVCRAEAVLVAAPAQHVRALCRRAAPSLRAGTPVVICAKGIEQQSLALMSEVVAETLPHAVVAVLSGPTFAREVAQGLLTAVTLACVDAAIGRALAEALGSRSFRPYLSADVIGAQIGGSVKNVLAIAAGIVVGRHLGENARAALITRGLAEMLRLGEALGAKRDTLMGLSGLGDLVLTCGSPQSRNMSLGVALAEGATLATYVAQHRSVAEGVFSAAAVAALANRHGADMPIAAAVDRILRSAVGIDEALRDLLSRPLRSE
ncbi:MAG: NAD(P)-dependent glycerol-3-phosphate dehydrogenase [Alphaproteobacteria bacterium]|nr:NAD(P)-dependent glycerol-3-phosphate dehydrogenase [Alphaproteobacteria bacterium]